VPGGPRLWAGNALGPVDSDDDDARSPRSLADAATRRPRAVFFIAGAPAGEVVAGAGFALAAIPGAVGIAEERRRERAEADSRRRIAR